MGYNKIPLALGFNDSTGNASGLVEFTLNLSDVGNVCSGTTPTTGQALVYNSDGEWCPGDVGAGTFSGNLSDVGDVCDNSPSTGQALVWSGSEWCPSTIPTGGGGGAVNSVNTQTGDVSLYLSSLSGVDTSDLQADHHIVYDDATSNWTSQYSQKLFVIASNQTGSDLVRGAVVYVSGVTTGGDPEVSLARADSSDTMPSIGVVAERIPSTETGPVISFGTALGLTFDVAPTGTDVGKTVYVSPTNAGQVTVTKPTNANHLIQNVGILVDDSPVKVKVTGVGRANDVPNSATFNGSVTVGTNSLTQSDAQLDGTTADHLVITNASNKISSVASSTLFTQGIADNNIATTPIPAADLADTYVSSVNGETGASVTLTTDNIDEGTNPDRKYIASTEKTKLSNIELTGSINLDAIPSGNLAQTYIQDAAGTVDPANLNGTVSDTQLVRVNGAAFNSIPITSESVSFLATSANLGDLTDVALDDSPNAGDRLVYRGDGQWTSSATQQITAGGVAIPEGEDGNYVLSNVLTTPVGTTGKGDVDTGFVFVSGTNASSTEIVGDNFGKIWVTGPDQDISNGDYLVYFSSTTLDPGSSGTAAIQLSDNALGFLQNDTLNGTLSVIQNDTSLDTLYLEADASGNEAAPVLTFQRDSDSPDDGDYLGQIKFKGKSDTNVDRVYAKITGKTSDVSNGIEDGLIEFAIRSNGSNLICQRITHNCVKIINGCGLEVDGTLAVTGNATVSNVDVQGTLDVTGDTTVSNIDVQGTLDVSTINASGDVTVSGNVITDGLTVTRVGQGRPTAFRWECDYLSPGSTQNGWGSHSNGTGAGIGGHWSDMINGTDYGVGVNEVRSGTATSGRASMTTFNNTLVASAMGVSMAGRVTMSGLWSNGSNDGFVIFGVGDNTNNATDPSRGVYFKYDNTNANWQAISSKGGTDTVSDTGVGVSAAAFQVLQVMCNDDWDTAQFFIDGSLVATHTLAGGHNIPIGSSGQMGLQIRVVNDATNVTDGNELWIDWHVIELTHTRTDRGEGYIKAQLDPIQ